ncbi:DUF6174 domain-containing protein [Alteromonas sp. ASW11-130]|uniref:DUF6174 domain-containing protein n=1 Tax=Alteromonas sp. ASW11-130 TaxID=3015775 RepID=UPI00224253E5|nr:DUF6174 domain-containing protein [Alteromonas sp. ASW11-130]MCW8092432.1 DUF6174 domain-containing protein [Alteromonas sp. ASW11-130]
MNKYLVVIISGLLLGCGNENEERVEQNLREIILEKQTAWEATGINSYTFTYSETPNDCPTAQPFPPVEIQVVEGKITSLYIPSQGSYLEPSERVFPTIDRVFINMKQQVDTLQGTPEFDNTLHFPVKYSVEKSAAPCDGHIISISSFI